MRIPLAALPALALTLALGPNGAGDAPPHVGDAIAEQRNLTSERPEDAGVWNDLGNLLVLAGSLDEAESAYGRALELDPGSVQAHFNLGLLRQQRGDLGGAVAEYLALLELDPGHAWAQYQLGAAYDAQGQRELALERYSEAFTLDPELLFAEKNPHIIENRLVTEALLRARRGSRSAPPAPRDYDEPARIKSILTPPPAKPAVTPAPEGEREDDEAAPAADGSHSGAAARDQIERGPAPRDRGSDSTATAPATSQSRVLHSSDLRGSVRNQVRGDAEGGGEAPATSRRRAGATVTAPGGKRSSVSQPPANDPSRAFGVGQRSTGSLEWKLGPASDEPVPAR